MTCSSCGGELRDGAVFCPVCGTPVSKPATPPASSVTEAPKKTDPQKEEAIPPRALSPKHKNALINGGIRLLLLVLYIGAFFLLYLSLTTEKSIAVNTLFSKKLVGHLSVSDLTGLLTKGNVVFNPSAISSSLGICVNVLVYASPFFAFIAFISTFFKRRTLKPAICAAVFFTVAAAAVSLVTLLALTLIPFLPEVLAKELNFLPTDIGTITYVKPIILSSVAFLLSVASVIVTVILNKRRSR